MTRRPLRAAAVGLLVALTVTLGDNSSVDALKERLAGGPVAMQMRDCGGMEKVGPLGHIDGATPDELRLVLGAGAGDISVTMSLD